MELIRQKLKSSKWFSDSVKHSAWLGLKYKKTFGESHCWSIFLSGQSSHPLNIKNQAHRKEIHPFSYVPHFQCDPMRQFCTIWAIFKTFGYFFPTNYLLQVALWANFYLRVASLGLGLFINLCFFCKTLGVFSFQTFGHTTLTLKGAAISRRFNRAYISASLVSSSNAEMLGNIA